MRKIIMLISFLLLFISCSKKEEVKEELWELSPEYIMKIYGIGYKQGIMSDGTTKSFKRDSIEVYNYLFEE